MENIIIRKYKDSDKDEVIQCIEELQEHERKINPSKKPGKEISLSYLNLILKECSEKDGVIYVAEMSDKVVGFSCMWIEYEDDPNSEKEELAYFSDLYVRPEYRRQGIGTRLINARLEYAKEKGLKKARVFTLAGNPGIQETLKSQGFTPYEIVWEKEIK